MDAKRTEHRMKFAYALVIGVMIFSGYGYVGIRVLNVATAPKPALRSDVCLESATILTDDSSSLAGICSAGSTMIVKELAGSTVSKLTLNSTRVLVTCTCPKK